MSEPWYALVGRGRCLLGGQAASSLSSLGRSVAIRKMPMSRCVVPDLQLASPDFGGRAKPLIHGSPVGEPWRQALPGVHEGPRRAR
jgi:hypothetical protein